MTTRNGDMPAMPMVIEKDEYVWCEGLTKREQFAMAAMQGILANPHYATIEMNIIANQSVEAADALLAELDKAGGE